MERPSFRAKKPRREEAWSQLEKESFQANERVTGVIFGRVKVEFTVDLSGAIAFLPGSQVDIRPVRDIRPTLGVAATVQILKMDPRGATLSCRAARRARESRAEQRSELVANLKEGQILNGVCQEHHDYGAFCRSRRGRRAVARHRHRLAPHQPPSEALNIGQTVKIQVIRFNPETQRISLGMKRARGRSLGGCRTQISGRSQFRGRVTQYHRLRRLCRTGAGVEGLVHVSEMSWTKKNVHPGKIVSTSQEVEVMVLDVDPQKRRISLGLKQTLANPWEAFVEEHPVDSELKVRFATSRSSASSSACPARSTA